MPQARNGISQAGDLAGLLNLRPAEAQALVTGGRVGEISGRLEDRLRTVLAERDRFEEALRAIALYARAPHEKIGEACGVDACTGCLIEGTAKEALGEFEQDGKLPDDFGGPTVGYCSKCGEARDSFYTCRDGGHTVAKENGE